MATLTWTNTAGDAWATGADWSSGSAPGPGDSALITVPGSYQVTAFGIGTIAVAAVTLDAAGATLALEGGEALAIGSTLLLQAGTVQLGGTIQGGTIDFAGGTMLPSVNGSLAGASIAGTAVLGGIVAVGVENGLQLLGGAGTPAVLDLQGVGLSAANSGTIGGGTILLDGTAYFGPMLLAYAGTTTLAPDLTVVGEGANAGEIIGNVVNLGLVTVDAGHTLAIGRAGYAGTFVNGGSIAVARGGTVEVLQPFQNTGSIDDGGATAVLGGSISPAEFAAFAATGPTIEVAGMFDEGGGTLTVGAGGIPGLMLAGGTILDATIQMEAGGTLKAVYGGGPKGVLSGVTLAGSETLRLDRPYLAVADGLRLTGADGTGAGTLALGDGLTFTGPQLVSGGTIVLTDSIFGGSLIASGGQLTLGPDMLVSAEAGAGLPYAPPSLVGDVLNEGEVSVVAGSTLSVGSGGTFTNAGGLTVAAGGTLLIAGAVANSGTASVGGLAEVVGSVTGAQLLADRTAFGAPLVLAGTLDNTGSTLAVGAGSGLGTLTLAEGGWIGGGTISDPGDGLIATGGTLSGVTYRGAVQAASGVLDITGGLTLLPFGLAGAALNVLPGATLGLLDTELIDDATINLGGTIAGTLALGANAVLAHTSFGSPAPAESDFGGLLVNAGLVSLNLPGATLTISSLSNSGTVSVSSIDFLSVGTLSNAGAISVSSGAALSIGDIAANSGHITETGATLNLYGPISLSLLEGISRSGGIINIEGTVSLGGGTLTVGGGTALNQLRNDNHDAITGGTIHDAGSGLIFVGPEGLGGTLSADTFQGTLNLIPAGSTLTLAGVSFTGLGGTGQGTIDLLGAASYLALEGSQTLNNVILNVGNSYRGVTLAIADRTAAGGAAVTLGPGTTLTTWGAQTGIAIGRNLGDSLINQGVLGVTGNGTSLLVTGGTFTNQGQILVANGGTLGLESDAVGNTAGGALSGGSWQILANSMLDLGLSDPITTVNTSLYFSGPGSQVEYLNDATFQETTLDQTLGTVGAAGTLYIVNGRIFAPPSMAVSGRLQLSGGTLSAAGVTITSGGGNLIGTGAIAGGTIYDSGILMAQGGALSVNAAILPGPSGAGQVWINVGATLAASAQVAAPVRFIGASGELVLAQPMQMTGAITGFTGADLIDLVGVGTAGLLLSYAASGGSSGVLTVKTGSTTVAALDFLGSYVTGNFTFAPDGQGGTLIEDPPVPVTPALLGDRVMAFAAAPAAADPPRPTGAVPALMPTDLGAPAVSRGSSGGAIGGTVAPGIVVGAAIETQPPVHMPLIGPGLAN